MQRRFFTPDDKFYLSAVVDLLMDRSKNLRDGYSSIDHPNSHLFVMLLPHKLGCALPSDVSSRLLRPIQRNT